MTSWLWFVLWLSSSESLLDRTTSQLGMSAPYDTPCARTSILFRGDCFPTVLDVTRRQRVSRHSRDVVVGPHPHDVPPDPCGARPPDRGNLLPGEPAPLRPRVRR